MWGLQVSPHGTVWTAGARDSGLYRLSADRWTHYGREQFGSPDDWLQGGFAVHQEQVWGPTGQGIVRFDGESWKFYAYRFKHGRPMATVAGRAGVWILEGERTLTYFDGRNEFSLPLPKNAQKVPVAFDRWDRRSLILTGDDHLWFLSDGLWRWERGAWREIRSDLHLPDAVPVGHSQDRVWLWLRRSGEVVSITPDGSVARRAGLRELGLEYGTQIRDVAESRGEIRIATDEGLVSFENGKWRNFRRPPGTAAVTDVALGPDGSTWVIGETRPIGNLIRSRSLPLGIAMLSMVALGILISKWLRGKPRIISRPKNNWWPPPALCQASI